MSERMDIGQRSKVLGDLDESLEGPVQRLGGQRTGTEYRDALGITFWSK